MAHVIRFRNKRGDLAEPGNVSASDAKNSFGRVLDRVSREGAVAITKHDEPCAVLISIEQFQSLVDAESMMLDTLSADFDALFEHMQKQGAAVNMQKAFAMTPAQLGRAAVKHAAAVKPRNSTAPIARRASTKGVRRAHG